MAEIEDQHFDESVQVLTGEHGHARRHITSAAQAADMLLNHWPASQATKRHRTARQACLDVLSGIKKAHVARQAFEAAAKEADILVEPGMLSRDKIR